MAFRKGKEFRLTVGDKKLYHETEFNISITAKSEDISSKDTAGDESVPDGYNYTFTVNSLTAAAPTGSGAADYIIGDTLVDALLAGTLLEWSSLSAVGGSRGYSGQCYCTQADITASNGTTVTGNFSFKGNGDILPFSVTA